MAEPTYATLGSVWDMPVTDAAAMQSVLSSERPKSQDSGPSASCALWPVELQLTHMDWNPEATLIHFQGQYLTICELDYSTLQGEIQNVPKTKAPLDIGEFCLVEDMATARWYRGRVQKRKEEVFDVFLIDHGNVLSVDIAHISSCSNDLFILPPKIVCGFLANVLLLPSCSHSVVEKYLSSLIGRYVTGYIQALLPHKVLLLEVPDINSDLVRHGFGRHVDTDTFFLLVEMLTEVPLKKNTEPAPDLLVEKPEGQEFCFRPPNLHRYKDILSFCRPRLSCGTRAKVQVTAAVNTRLLYCQMVSMKKELLEMSERLAADCEYQALDCSKKTSENLGLLCSVKSKDGKWYRGFVQFLPTNSQVRVLFIDYGFFESVKVENVHRLPPDLYSVPIMAFPCSLPFLSDHDDATQQLGFLKSGLLGQVLDMQITSFDEEQLLYTITLYGAEDGHVKEPEPSKEFCNRDVVSAFETQELSPQGGSLYYETVVCESLHKSLDKEVQKDSVFVGYVEHVQNPNNFWMRTKNRNDEFEEMMTNMASHFNQVKLDEDVLVNPQLGTLCCAVHENDMHFYRAVVTDTLKHGAEVFFVDFGNTEKVPYMLIKNIPEAFASIPPFAFCCSLGNLYPLDEMWTSKTSDFFRKAVSNKPLLVHVVEMRKNKIVVDLFDMGCDRSQSIADLLISSSQAECWKTSTLVCTVQNTDATERTKCPRSTASDFSRNIEQSEGYEEDTGEVKSVQAPVSFKALSIKPGCEFAVRCTRIDSPSDFWCQPEDKIAALEELMDKLQLFYSTNTAPLQSGISCCVAKSPLDGRWYRAVIAEKQYSQASVTLIDYGFSIQVKEHNLKAIMPEFVYLESEAFRCCFSNLIEPADSQNHEDWTQEVCDTVKTFVLDSSGGITCKVISQLHVQNKGLCNVVDLYSTQTQQSVTNWLVEQGLAREATVLTKQLSTVSPESFVYSSFDLSPGNEEPVYVTHVSSQWEVYCQLQRNTEICEELEKRISEESKKMMQVSSRAVVKKLCLAKYLDGKWYRGLTYSVQSPLHFGVFFVDYGNRQISEKKHVLSIPRDAADLLYTPMQAVRCCLSSVSKEELYADVKDWLDSAVLNKQVKAIILGKGEDGSFDIELFDGDVNINKKMKELILSLSPKQKTVVATKTRNSKLKTYKCQSSIMRKTQPSCRSSNCPTTKPNRSTQRGNEPHKKQDKTKNSARGKAQNKNTKMNLLNKDKSKTCAFLKPHKNCQVTQRDHQDTEQKTEQAQNTSTKDTNTKEIPRASSLPEKMVRAGLRVKCFISHVDAGRQFFLHLSEDEPAILKMGEDLNSEICRKSLKTVRSVSINDLVLAEYEEDGALYRAVVKNCEGSSCAIVEFVDYGNSAVVESEKIYQLPHEYFSQPRFSICCILLDTSTFENDTAFAGAVMEKPVMVDFVCQNDAVWEVKAEILDEKRGFAAPEEAFGSSPVNEIKKEASLDSIEKKEKVRSCKQIYNGVFKSNKEKNKKKTLGRVLYSVKRKKRTLPINQLKLKNCRHHNRRIAKSRSGLKMNQRKKSTPSFKAMSVCADAIRRLIIKTMDREKGTVHPVTSKQNKEVIFFAAETSNEATEKEPSFDAVPPEKLTCAPVDTDKVYCGCAVVVMSPFDFCVVLQDLLLTMYKVSIMLEELPGQMSCVPEAHLVRGTCCLFKSDSKNKWCRTEIVHVNTSVVLNLVDYGHYECIAFEDHSKLARLPEELMRLPKVTYPCILRGVKPVKEGEQWTDEAATFFQQCLLKKNLQIFFREFVAGTHWIVDVTTDGVDVAKELVDSGHAAYDDVMLGVRFQEQTHCTDRKDEKNYQQKVFEGMKLLCSSSEVSQY